MTCRQVRSDEMSEASEITGTLESNEDKVPVQDRQPDASYSAFFTCSLSFGAVPSAVTLPFSISAAQSAAPAVFVKENRIDARGTSSSRTAVTPKLTFVN